MEAALFAADCFRMYERLADHMYIHTYIHTYMIDKGGGRRVGGSALRSGLLWNV